MWNDHDLPASAIYYERALEYDPGNLNIIGNAALLLKSLGRLDEALDLLEFHAPRDPLNPTAQYNLGLTYLSAGRWAESIELQQTTLQLSPEYWGSHTFIATALLMQGKAREALEVVEKEPSEAYRLLGRIMVLNDLGQSAESEAELSKMIDKYEKEWAYNIAYVLAYRKDVDRAFEWLDKAVEYGDPGLADIVAEVLFSNLHPDPRWAVFLERIGKSPEQRAAIKFNVTFQEGR
jgi:tetratricopeptide (TPR) repeat protein